MLVIVVEGEVPPGAVFFLQGDEDVGQVSLEIGPFFRRRTVRCSRRRRSVRSSRNTPATFIHDSCGMGRLRAMSSHIFRENRRSSQIRITGKRYRSSSPQSRMARLQTCDRPRAAAGAVDVAHSHGISGTRRSNRRSPAAVAARSKPWPGRRAVCGTSTPISSASFSAIKTVLDTKQIDEPLGRCVLAFIS